MRRTPLQRKTPLTAKKGIARGASQLPRGVRTSAPRVALPAMRSKPRRKNRDGDQHGLAWSDVRLVVYARAGGRCEGCGVQLNLANMEGHHRRTRRLGPDCPGNCLCLCRRCHHDEVHAHPEKARGLGQILRREEQDPCSRPVWTWALGWVVLHCDGTYETVDAA
jgi:hypothetical protein